MVQSLKNSMIVVVESLINKLEEDQLRKEEMVREKQRCQSSSQYNDNCSDSDSSFNQVRDTTGLPSCACIQTLIFCIFSVSYCCTCPRWNKSRSQSLPFWNLELRLHPAGAAAGFG